MSTVYLALGSNIGNRRENLSEAVQLLNKTLTVIESSIIYETDPVGYLQQDKFLNAVLRCQTDLSAKEVLELCIKIEEKLGRIRKIKNGPRTIDVDILFYDDLILWDSELIIPHPKISERLFVLAPLCDVAENFVHPVLNKTILELFDAALKINSRTTVKPMHQNYIF